VGLKLTSCTLVLRCIKVSIVALGSSSISISEQQKGYRKETEVENAIQSFKEMQNINIIWI